MGKRRPVAAILMVGVLAAVTLAGCAMPQAEAPCTLDSLLTGALAYFRAAADPKGGVPATAGWSADARTTAWVLLATGLARRAGHEGTFTAEPHLVYLASALARMSTETSPTDSAANNLSLARAALQVWGRPAGGVAFQDPATGDDTTLAAAWERHYDPTNATYGTRVNEHLFGVFAVWLFEPAGPRRDAMGERVSAIADTTPDAYTGDAWYAAYARLALGPDPDDDGLALELDSFLLSHQASSGGLRGPVAAMVADASSTAAALLAWAATGTAATAPHVEAAIGYLCDLQGADGAIPFSARLNVARTKTTAEVVIALALLAQPIPWSDDA